jgi:hypothetical protein
MRSRDFPALWETWLVHAFTKSLLRENLGHLTLIRS